MENPHFHLEAQLASGEAETIGIYDTKAQATADLAAHPPFPDASDVLVVFRCPEPLSECHNSDGCDLCEER